MQTSRILSGQSIFDFTVGDIITQVVPCEAGNFRGDPLELLAIENNMIYLKHLTSFEKGKIEKISLEGYSRVWAKFVLPEGLTIDQC